MSKERAMLEANRFVRMRFGSVLAKDRPTVLGSRSFRPFTLFKTTVMFIQSIYRRTWRKSWNAHGAYLRGDMTGKQWLKTQAGQGLIIGTYMSTALLEDFISTFNIEDDEDRRKAQQRILTWWNILITSVTRAIPFGDALKRTALTGQPINLLPVLGVLSGVLQALRTVIIAKKPKTKLRAGVRAVRKGTASFGFPIDGIISSKNFVRSISRDVLRAPSDRVTDLFFPQPTITPGLLTPSGIRRRTPQEGLRTRGTRGRTPQEELRQRQ